MQVLLELDPFHYKFGRLIFGHSIQLSYLSTFYLESNLNSNQEAKISDGYRLIFTFSENDIQSGFFWKFEVAGTRCCLLTFVLNDFQFLVRSIWNSRTELAEIFIKYWTRWECIDRIFSFNFFCFWISPYDYVSRNTFHFYFPMNCQRQSFSECIHVAEYKIRMKDRNIQGWEISIHSFKFRINRARNTLTHTECRMVLS